MLLFLSFLILTLNPIDAFASGQLALGVCNIVIGLTQGTIVLGIAAISIVATGYYILMKGAANLDKNDTKIILRVILGVGIVISAEHIVSMMLLDEDENCDNISSIIAGRNAAESFTSWVETKATKNEGGCDGYGSCKSYASSFVASSFEQIFYNNPQIVNNLGSSDNYNDFLHTTNGSGQSESFYDLAKEKSSDAISYYRKNIAAEGESRKSEGEIDYVTTEVIKALEQDMVERSTQVTYH
jgi:hypothetical protein